MQNSKRIMNISKCIFSAIIAAFIAGAAHCVELTGTASVNITSDTAAAAKNMAFDEARRQIIIDAVGQYANPEQLRGAVSDAADLVALIASSGIDGEKLSDTTYSANIKMTLDNAAIRKWLLEKNVQNWLPDENGGAVFTILATLSDPVADWAELNRIARAERADLSTKYMIGNQVMVELPSANRGAFTIALRESGWHYSNNDGVLRVWK